ncbi:hypothetical protein CEXT_645741 [Caerostris extrusa]|uniref:Uncharacterized protein n=1 Tax=Caerostris extrusa TaxID=172846 RepID=A0AAV4YC95_CAEEX|nr:hypothetical protein CEXT_645741 [Caerostris extrusa]
MEEEEEVSSAVPKLHSMTPKEGADVLRDLAVERGLDLFLITYIAKMTQKLYHSHKPLVTVIQMLHPTRDPVRRRFNSHGGISGFLSYDTKAAW